MAAHLQEASSSSTFTNITVVDTPPTPPPQPADAPPTIPEAHDRRTIVLCFDGTGDGFDDDNSNVVEFFALLKKDDPDKQVVWYHPGIGISATPRYIIPAANKISSAGDKAIASSLDEHIKDGYSFLVQHYKFGDKICLFGFSRGAYTARALAGMLYKVGLLPRGNQHQVPFAYNLYKEDKNWEHANRFKMAFSIDVNIEFVGVWDTVNSVGIFPSKLPFTSCNSSIHYFRHAMALDEHRAKFQPDPWNEPPKSDDMGIPGNNTTPDEQRKERTLAKDTDCHCEHTHVKEVWFAGCHCDVGGGSVKNGTPRALARIPLRWMVRECFKTGTGIMFYTNALMRLGFNVKSTNLGPNFPPLNPGTSQIRDLASDRLPHPKPNCADLVTPISECTSIEREEEQELQDALSPIYDQLELKWSWWLLEGIPFKRRSVERQLDGSTKFVSTRWPNFKGPREVMMPAKGNILVHRSVKTRIDAGRNGKDYQVIPSLEKAIKEGKVEWVE